MSRYPRKGMKIESMKVQQDFFASLLSRHQIWSSDTNDPDIVYVHSEIIQLIRQLIEKYSHLIGLYLDYSNSL